MMNKNYVCNGAKIMCPLCTNPQGTLKVTSNQVKIQDKFFATEADKAKINLMFQGNCIKSPYQSSPCQAVITPSNWQGTADALVQDNKALLETSTIICSYGDVPISIVNDLQISVPTILLPIMAPVILPVEEPQYLSLEWKDYEGVNTITENEINGLQRAYLQTMNIVPGEVIFFTVSEKNNVGVKNGSKKVAYHATVDHEGVAFVEIQNASQAILDSAAKEPKVIDLAWMNDKGEKIDSAKKNDAIYLYVKVENIAPGEQIEIFLDDNDGNRIKFIAAVDNNGIALLKQ